MKPLCLAAAILFAGIGQMLAQCSNTGESGNCVVTNPAASQTITQPSSTGLSISGGNGLTVGATPGATIDSSGNLTGLSINTIINAAKYPTGADIFAKAGNAFTSSSCGKSCTVYIPAGNYMSVTTTLSWPVTGPQVALWCDEGATINFSGTGYAIEALGAGLANANIRIYGGCTILGSSSSAGGIHLQAVNQARIDDLRISGFSNTSADGVFLDGANTVELYGVRLASNTNGLRCKGVTVGSTNYACNANQLHGGYIVQNTQWGIYDDASGPGTNEKNIYETTIENNGLAANHSSSGNVFIQGCNACELRGYSEMSSNNVVDTNITIGDGTFQAKNTKIDMVLLSTSGTNAINNVNGFATYIAPTTQRAP